MDQQGKLESTAVGLGSTALAFIIETGQQADFEWFLTERTGEPVRYEDPEHADWDKVLEFSMQACAHISRMFQQIVKRRAV